ncbi:2OG-Fe(II) oxygenase [Geothrix paludis]|uniref:2OG-Fe(II) oxygenase n=1 Tax=Geothrix paludis TaxID=2922722 RepID=UPI001FAC2B1E|nr:2OG-Fe(II) oxygenase [Geothrix paludis]
MHPLSPDVHTLPWDRVQEELWSRGVARIPGLLAPGACRKLVATYDTGVFRSRIDMARHRFGKGEYKYFAAPLPSLVQVLRSEVYARLASLANAWMEALRQPVRYPPTHAAFLEACVAAGQTRPTPLLLRYGPGDHNCLHQDLYGDLTFPLQMAVFLDDPGLDYEGGEFLLVEQHPRAQSRGLAFRPAQGEALIFPSHVRPGRGERGFHQVHVRHGVSEVRAGRRHVLGLIFQDAA